MNQGMVKTCLAGACGLYCGTCSSDDCHGCGCKCGQCAGSGRLGVCPVGPCISSRKVESCADCEEFPCTRLIEFTHDPVFTTHAVCIDNLRRRQRIGTEKWIEEQKEYFSDDRNRKMSRFRGHIATSKRQEWAKFES